MKKFNVVLTETLTYKLEIEAETEEQAVELAFNDIKFTTNVSDDNDTTWEVNEVEDEE